MDQKELSSLEISKFIAHRSFKLKGAFFLGTLSVEVDNEILLEDRCRFKFSKNARLGEYEIHLQYSANEEKQRALKLSSVYSTGTHSFLFEKGVLVISDPLSQKVLKIKSRS